MFFNVEIVDGQLEPRYHTGMIMGRACKRYHLTIAKRNLNPGRRDNSLNVGLSATYDDVFRNTDLCKLSKSLDFSLDLE